jgi:hypothetical protein
VIEPGGCVHRGPESLGDPLEPLPLSEKKWTCLAVRIGLPWLVSLSEDGTSLDAPRLVTDGDVRGGRYVSGVVDLVVGQGQLQGWPGWGGR